MISAARRCVRVVDISLRGGGVWERHGLRRVEVNCSALGIGVGSLLVERQACTATRRSWESSAKVPVVARPQR